MSGCLGTLDTWDLSALAVAQLSSLVSCQFLLLLISTHFHETLAPAPADLDQVLPIAKVFCINVFYYTPQLNQHSRANHNATMPNYPQHTAYLSTIVYFKVSRCCPGDGSVGKGANSSSLTT